MSDLVTLLTAVVILMTLLLMCLLTVGIGLGAWLLKNVGIHFIKCERNLYEKYECYYQKYILNKPLVTILSSRLKQYFLVHLTWKYNSKT